MRILLITPLFQPEPNYIKGLEFAKRLQRDGHSVQVLTVYPNYPMGKIYPGYGMKLFQKDIIEGIEIIRVASYLSHDKSSAKRFLTYVTMSLSMTLFGLFLVKIPDVVHVYQGPATVLLPAIVLKVLRKVPYVLDLQDIWPDSVLSSGMMRSRVAICMISIWCDFTYRLASHIIVLSKGYKRLLEERGVHPSKTTVVYNWCDEPQIDQVGKDSAYALEENYFNIVYAGNIGQTQGMEIVIRAAEVLQGRGSRVRFIVIASGVAVESIQKSCEEKKLDNLKIIPRFNSFQDAISIMKKSDALFLHLKKDRHLGLGIPQKTQVYLAVGRPILIGVDGEPSELVAEAKAGVLFEPENAESLLSQIDAMERLNKEEVHEMGLRGRKFYLERMAFDFGVNKISEILSRAITGKEKK